MPPKEEYTTTEKKLALEALAVVLMRIRDGKQHQDGISSDGSTSVLVKLTNELMRIACEHVSNDVNDDYDYRNSNQYMDDFTVVGTKYESMNNHNHGSLNSNIQNDVDRSTNMREKYTKHVKTKFDIFIK